MRVRFLTAFDHGYRKLRPLERGRVQTAVDAVIDYLTTGRSPPAGLGLKKLGASYWEVRVGLQIRVLFALERDLLRFILVGNHNDIRRALKR